MPDLNPNDPTLENDPTLNGGDDPSLEGGDPTPDGNDGDEDPKGDLYNPFDEQNKGGEEDPAPTGDEDPDPKGDDPKEEDPTPDDGSNDRLAYLEAKDSVSDELDKFFTDGNNKVYESKRAEIKNLAVQAKLKGYNNPIEFAVRNVASPQEWIELGRNQATQAQESIESSDISGGNTLAPNLDASGLRPASELSDAELAETMAKAERGML